MPHQPGDLARIAGTQIAITTYIIRLSYTLRGKSFANPLWAPKQKKLFKISLFIIGLGESSYKEASLVRKTDNIDRSSGIRGALR